MLLVLKIQNRVTNELSGKSEDEDVQNERIAILEHPERFLNSMVLIKELTKVMSFSG